jgi:fructoselysine 6-kinase
MIATVGDNCMDVYSKLNQSYPGGNAVNVAVYLRRAGVDVSYIGFVGNDGYGEKMKSALLAKGVDINHVHTIDGKTAVTMVELLDGDRVFGDYDEGVMAGFKLSEADIRYISDMPMIHTAIWGNIENQLPQLKQLGKTISFDFSDQLDHEIIAKALSYIDYAFFSYTQDDEYIRNYILSAWQPSLKNIIVTLGEHGSIAYDGKSFMKQDIIPVQVVDTMGAGDSFIAGFLAGILNQQPLVDCLKLGAESSAITIQYMGAWHVN